MDYQACRAENLCAQFKVGIWKLWADIDQQSSKDTSPQEPVTTAAHMERSNSNILTIHHRPSKTCRPIWFHLAKQDLPHPCVPHHTLSIVHSFYVMQSQISNKIPEPQVSLLFCLHYIEFVDIENWSLYLRFLPLYFPCIRTGFCLDCVDLSGSANSVQDARICVTQLRVNSSLMHNCTGSPALLYSRVQYLPSTFWHALLFQNCCSRQSAIHIIQVHTPCLFYNSFINGPLEILTASVREPPKILLKYAITTANGSWHPIATHIFSTPLKVFCKISYPKRKPRKQFIILIPELTGDRSAKRVSLCCSKTGPSSIIQTAFLETLVASSLSWTFFLRGHNIFRLIFFLLCNESMTTALALHHHHIYISHAPWKSRTTVAYHYSGPMADILRSTSPIASTQTPPSTCKNCSMFLQILTSQFCQKAALHQTNCTVARVIFKKTPIL